jgi:hypothetical protein
VERLPVPASVKHSLGRGVIEPIGADSPQIAMSRFDLVMQRTLGKCLTRRDAAAHICIDPALDPAFDHLAPFRVCISSTPSQREALVEEMIGRLFGLSR